VLDLADLLTELCPSYVRRKGGLLNGVLRRAKAGAGDTSTDLIGDGAYIRFAWQAYEKYRSVNPATIGTLDKMMHNFPRLDVYANEVNKASDVQIVRARMNERVVDERAKALVELISSIPGMHTTKPFRQGEYTSELVNKNGVCAALTLDWVRRKMWNSAAGDVVKRKREVWEGSETQIKNRMMRVDAMQSRRGNIVDPMSTMSSYDEVRQKGREAKDKDPGTAKSFGALMEAANSVELKWTKQGADAYYLAFNTGCAAQGDKDFALVVAVNKTFNVGHVFGFFRSKGVWHLFDPNYGEFELKEGQPETMGSKWYEMYFVAGFRDVQIAKIARKT